MNKLQLIPVMAGLLGGCVTREHSFRNAAEVITPSIHSAGHLLVPSWNLEASPRGAPRVPWSATEAEFLIGEGSIANELGKTHKNIADYYLRVAGIVRDGRRVLVGVGINKGEAKAEFYLRPALPHQSVDVGWGGGDSYFRFEYDCDGKMFTWFAFNAAL